MLYTAISILTVAMCYLILFVGDTRGVPVSSDPDQIIDRDMVLTRRHLLEIQRRRLCGRQLIEAMALICESRYCSPVRPQPLQRIDNDDSEEQRNSNQQQIISVNQQASSEGLVEECCYRPCQLATMASYCCR